jgi:hypothetical protein
VSQILDLAIHGGSHGLIGNAVSLLCSAQARWITGQTIYADGGASLMDTVFPLEIQGAQTAKVR